jgi:hypothetical protein
VRGWRRKNSNISGSVQSDVYTFSVVNCSGSSSACGTASLSAAGNAAIAITGSPIQSITAKGDVDTFLEFSITSPIQNITSFSFSITGCGGNTGVGGSCAGTGATDYTSTQVYLYSDSGFTNQINSAPTVAISATSPNVMTASVSQNFAALTTVYVKVDIKSNVTSSTVLASLYSVTLSVPEPASAALLAFSLVGFVTLRRRRRYPPLLVAVAPSVRPTLSCPVLAGG